jgi:hypothetical protein
MGLVCGVGINDLAKGAIGAQKPEYYKLWTRILNRCYNPIVHAKQPSYERCSISDSWVNLSDFKKFHDDKFIPTWELDKDLIKPGNTIYGPEHCVFIPKWLNRFARGCDLKTGTSYNKQHKLFGTYCHDPVENKKVFLGYYKTVEDAHRQWLRYKLNLALQYKDLCDSIDGRLYDGIVRKLTVED